MQEYVYRILNENKNKFTEKEKIIIYNNQDLFIKIFYNKLLCAI